MRGAGLTRKMKEVGGSCPRMWKELDLEESLFFRTKLPEGKVDSDGSISIPYNFTMCDAWFSNCINKFWAEQKRTWINNT